jgi:hypothetical protein
LRGDKKITFLHLAIGKGVSQGSFAEEGLLTAIWMLIINIIEEQESTFANYIPAR